MAWTAPMTAVAGSAFTAVQFNTHVRDNLLETAPAKATAEGQYFVATGLNTLETRLPGVAFVATFQSTTSSSYTDLATAGPAVTVTTGSTALVCIEVDARVSTGTSGHAIASYAVSGATSISPAHNRAFSQENFGTTDAKLRGGITHLLTGLNPGSNTFTMKYRRDGTETAEFGRRRISVVPF